MEHSTKYETFQPFTATSQVDANAPNTRSFHDLLDEEKSSRTECLSRRTLKMVNHVKALENTGWHAAASNSQKSGWIIGVIQQALV